MNKHDKAELCLSTIISKKRNKSKTVLFGIGENTDSIIAEDFLADYIKKTKEKDIQTARFFELYNKKWGFTKSQLDEFSDLLNILSSTENNKEEKNNA